MLWGDQPTYRHGKVSSCVSATKKMKMGIKNAAVMICEGVCVCVCLWVGGCVSVCVC